MNIPLLDLKAQYAPIREEIRAAIDRVMDSQHFILGPETQKFEEEIATYCGVKYAVGVSSGTDALLLCLMVLGVQPGDEVITPSFTFFATAGAVARLGATPIFVDIDPLTFNLDPAQLEAAITPRTKAIIPVHLFGQSANLDAIMTCADKYGIPVIEDAAQAIGTCYNGQSVGSVGAFGCFSFFPSKNLGGAGDAGLVTTNDPHRFEQLKLFRNHGYAPKYFNKVVGGNFRLDELQAAVLRVKLPHLDQWTKQRQENARRYCHLFEAAGITTEPNNQLCLHANCRSEACYIGKHIVLPTSVAYSTHIYNQFVIRTPLRDALLIYLKSCGIGAEIYYPRPMHLQECFSHLPYREGDLPASECASREALAIPIYPELTADMQAIVVATISDFIKETSG